MPIYKTNQFWNYIVNESDAVLSIIKKKLKRIDYDKEKEEDIISTYYQEFPWIDGSEVLRYPAGLTDYILRSASISVEEAPLPFRTYTEKDVRAHCNRIAELNPKFEVRTYQVDAALTSLNTFQSLIHSGVGSGKEQPCDTLIPTPNGERRFGDLLPGDFVFGRNGLPQRVTGIFPQGSKAIYKMSFKNGAHAECGLEHLWTVIDESGMQSVLTLDEIMRNRNDGKIYRIDYIEPVQFPQSEAIPQACAVNNVTKCLGASIPQRKEMLALILDQRAQLRKGRIIIKRSGKKLTAAICQLAWSLGGGAVYDEDAKSLELFFAFNPFNRANLARDEFKPNLPENTITDIEYVRDAEAMCIKVENADELYVTQNYILTHNTSVMSIVCGILDTDKILIMNGNNFILTQIYDRLVSFGIDDISWAPGKDPDYSKRIVILNAKKSDALLNKSDPQYIEFLHTVNTWITDEAHKMQALTCFEPLFYMDEEKLHHVIGYTGSPFRNHTHPYDDPQDFCTIALLGEPAFVYEMKDTIEDGNIAQPYGYFIRYPNKPCKLPAHLKDNYYALYRSCITYNHPRNHAGMEMLKFLDRYGIKTLASFNNIKPGQNMMKSLAECGIKSLFICGGNTIHEWERTPRGKLKLVTRKGGVDDVTEALNNGYNIIFGSQVMDEGVDIDIFQGVVLFSAGKTPIAGIQRIGRVSRKRKNGQNVSFVIDFQDIKGEYIFQLQYEKRKAMMEASGVKVLEKVLDFIQLIEDTTKPPS